MIYSNDRTLKSGPHSLEWKPHQAGLDLGLAQPHSSCSLRVRFAPVSGRRNRVTRCATSNYVIWPQIAGVLGISASEPMTGWQDSWTFRIVDQTRGGSPRGPGQRAREWRSRRRLLGGDSDGLVRIPKHDQPRLRLASGHAQRRSDRARCALTARRSHPAHRPARHRGSGLRHAAAPADSLLHAVTAAQSQSGHVMRFARIGVLPKDRDITAAKSPTPCPCATVF